MEQEEKEKRIVVRVGEAEWSGFDDKRHAERTSFQELGLRLFREWIGVKKAKDKVFESPLKNDTILQTGQQEFLQTLPESERTCISNLLNILHSGNEVAILAITSNLFAFADYIRAVPEVRGGFADIAAQAAQLAIIDQSIVEFDKATQMAGPPGSPSSGGQHEEKTRRTGVAAGVPRKKVR